jgi:peptide/nickel transport system permease protein
LGPFILRRRFQLVFVLWGGATLLFILFYVVGGNPAERMASGGGSRNPDPQVVANLEKRLGIDKPMPQQYIDYLSRTVRGDLGESYRTREPVVDIAKRRAPTSFRLAFWAVMIEASVGIGSGMLSARKRNSIGDYVTTIAAVVASAIPVFVLAYMLRQVTGVYAYQHGWPEWARFPTIGFGDDEWVLGVIPTGNTWRHLIQPAFVLAAVGTAMLARITRTSMLETMRLDHVHGPGQGLGEAGDAQARAAQRHDPRDHHPGHRLRHHGRRRRAHRDGVQPARAGQPDRAIGQGPRHAGGARPHHDRDVRVRVDEPPGRPVLRLLQPPRPTG